MIRNQNPSQEPPESSTTPDQDFEDMRVLCTFFFNVESWILKHWLFRTFLTPPHHDQEPETQVRNLQSPQQLQTRTSKTWGFFAPFYWMYKAEFRKIGCLGHSWPLPIMIRNQNPSQESTESCTPGLWGQRVLCIFLFNVETWILEHRLFGTFLTPPLHDQEPKPQSGTSIVLHNSKQGLQGHEGYLNLFIQCRNLNFWT